MEIDLTDNTLRKKIAARFGLTVPVFTSWITVVTLTRNACCHHALFFSNIFKPAAPFVFSEIPPVSNRLALESLLKEMSYSSILGTMSRFVLLPNC